MPAGTAMGAVSRILTTKGKASMNSITFSNADRYVAAFPPPYKELFALSLQKPNRQSKNAPVLEHELYSNEKTCTSSQDKPDAYVNTVKTSNSAQRGLKYVPAQLPTS
jgi:hypothetical protein